MGAPPWLKPGIQKGVEARNGDIWIAVPAKSGTNWTMNIVVRTTNIDDYFADPIVVHIR